ncbi:MAG: type II secretion system F family protein [Peptococcaceae bacterium]|nr:type II secretion system F family protein [Peptococcaceae bacterium]
MFELNNLTVVFYETGTALRTALKMPEVLAPAVMMVTAVMSVYVHRNIDKCKRSLTGLRDALEYEAARRDSVFDRYRLARDTAYKLKRLGAPVNYNAFLAGNALIALALALTSFLVLRNPYLTVISPVLWTVFSHQLVDKLYRTRVKARIDTQALLVLQLLAEVYSVSDNLQQAIERVIPSTPQPMRGELEKMILKANTNEDLNQCLVEFAANIDNRDIETFVHGIILSEQFGTDAKEVIVKNAEVIRDRMALREELTNETKGKKAVIGLFMFLLPAVFLWLFIGSEEARGVFTASGKGQMLVAVLVLVEYICWYFDSKKGVAEEL